MGAPGQGETRVANEVPGPLGRLRPACSFRDHKPFKIQIIDAWRLFDLPGAGRGRIHEHVKPGVAAGEGARERLALPFSFAGGVFGSAAATLPLLLP